MTVERWRRIEEVYHAALAHDEPSRGAFLAEISAGDVSLRQEVESLLKQGASSDGSLISWTKIMDEYKTWVESDEDNDVNIASAYKILSAQKR